MLNFKTWLEMPNIIRVVCIEIENDIDGAVNGILRISNYGVTMTNNATYIPVLDKLSINESVSLDYSPNVNSGEIEINNSNGTYDSWLKEIWTNKVVNVYVGSLPAQGQSNYAIGSDFQQVFSGYVFDIDAKNRKTINIKIRDILQKANTSVSSDQLGNYYQGSIVSTNVYNNTYANNLKPITLGEVHNITPLLIDPTTLEYMVHSDDVEAILEVRDNGVPVQFIISPPSFGNFDRFRANKGCFRLLKSPAGAVTCSVQGSVASVGFNYNIGPGITGPNYTYTNTAASNIAAILYAKANISPDYTSFGALGNQAIGVYVTSRVNLLSLCQEIAASCGLVLTTNRYGKVKLVDIIPTEQQYLPLDAMTLYPVILEADTILNSFVISNKKDVIAGVKIGYAKNWTLQPGLLTNIPEEHKSLFGTEYIEYLSKDVSIAAQHNITTEPELEGTYLITTQDATTLATKKLNIYKTQKRVYSMTCTSKYMYLEVGDIVRLSSPRFGINTANGASVTTFGIVIACRPDWIRGTIELEVFA